MRRGRWPGAQRSDPQERVSDLSSYRLAVGLTRGVGYRGCSFVVLLAACAWLSGADSAETLDAQFRVGFASSMFTDVNENDARAAVKAWGQSVAREHGVPTHPEPLILKDQAALREALCGKRVDAVGISMAEYAALYQQVRFGPIFVTYNAGRTTEEYLLLVRQESPIKEVADLRERHLVFHQNPRVSLAELWLETLFAQQGLAPASQSAGRITRASKLAKVVLPVFFRQADACLVTRGGLATMAELNPQVGKQLRVVVASPAFVPAVFVFRADYEPAFKEQLFAGVRDLHKTPAGQQVLTIFHSEKIEDPPAACLDSALQVIAQYNRCSRERRNLRAGAADPAHVAEPALERGAHLIAVEPSLRAGQ